NKMANAISKDKERKEAFILGQLRSIYAWRGSLVDTIIHERIVPPLNKGVVPDKDETISFMMELAEKQIDFAKDRVYRNVGVTKTSAGSEYCALYGVEYGDGLDAATIQKAKDDAKIAISNLLESELIEKLIAKDSYLISQRPLMINMKEFTIRGLPDLIVFNEEKGPSIIDWKVHTFGYTSAARQLGLYSLLFSRVKKHKDFPSYSKEKRIDTSAHTLLEYQLLKNQIKQYKVSPEELTNLEDSIYLSARNIIRFEQGLKFKSLHISDFPTARFPETCGFCNFKKLCWRSGGK
ncbi:MAG: PD-(D/E)XK nuclease family protein, partial [Candidatus Hodarchaeales archaeon]